MKLIHSMEGGSTREIKQVSDGDERSGSSLRAENLKGMLSDISNAESESDVDDVGLTVVQKSTDHSLLTPVHEEVKGSDTSIFCSSSSKHLLDTTPGAPQATPQMEMPIQLTCRKYFPTFGWLNNLGNAYISLHGTSAGRTLENLATGLITLLIRISSFFHLSVYRQERFIETVQPCAAAQEPEPQREEDMSACLRRLKKLESLCDHLMSKPPDMPKEKELVLMQSFDRIKSLEAELEATKNALQAAVEKQMELVETVEALQHQSTSVRRRFCCS
ncbi:Phosphatidylinositol/phosphatidylcholine transfer protein SFH13 [Zea mays]|nr:Phosphatidylinositol/phosphatidylcholine transfer protein SFH13 [Zea mays]